VTVWTVTLEDAALRDLSKLAKPERRRVIDALRKLEEDACPKPQSRPLKGDLAGARRLRVGELRIGYVLDASARSVTVWAIGHRQRFYEIATARTKR